VTAHGTDPNAPWVRAATARTEAREWLSVARAHYGEGGGSDYRVDRDLAIASALIAIAYSTERIATWLEDKAPEVSAAVAEVRRIRRVERER
jgi:hypothetical protein